MIKPKSITYFVDGKERINHMPVIHSHFTMKCPKNRKDDLVKSYKHVIDRPAPSTLLIFTSRRVIAYRLLAEGTRCVYG